MVTIVGKDVLTLKRDLKSIFPKEFSNRKLINQFITYILNNFFEQSKEKLVNAYVGQIIPDIDGTSCYVSEPSIERKINQIMPIVKTVGNSEDIITYNKFINSLVAEGCCINDEDKLLSSKYWSWCPPINVDMFINYNKYYWLTHDENELDFKVLKKSINVESEIIGKESYEYYEIDENGKKIESSIINLKDGLRVVFLNDVENKYNCIPYMVKIPENGVISLEPVIMPLVVLTNKVNVSIDIIGKKEYRYIDAQRNIDFEFSNGMRVYFLDDDIEELYSHKPLLIEGVGESIKLIDDTYKNENYDKDDYIVMERGSIDGNQWSVNNRWVHVSALTKFNTASMDYTTIEGMKPLEHASMPIICFNKNIELYKFGTFDRGTVITETDLIPSDVNGMSITDFCNKLKISEDYVMDGNSVLFLGNTGTSPKQIYTISLIDNNSVILHVNENGQSINGKPSDGSTNIGDTVYILAGESANKTKYYDGYGWKEGQTKTKVNQEILFNLYDDNGILLDNTVEYPNSDFKGSKLFGYKENNDLTVEVDEKIGKRLVKDDYDLNYTFENYIQSDKFNFNPPNDYKKEIIGYKYYKNIKTNELSNDWHLSNGEFKQYLKTTFLANDDTKFNDKEYTFELKYNISKNTNKNPLLVYKNGDFVPVAQSYEENGDIVYNKNVSGYSINDKVLTLYNTSKNDSYLIKIITDDEVSIDEEEYVYDLPLSLSVNQLNEDFDTIDYNNCFDHMIEIIQNQVGFVGSPIGDNNYHSLMTDVTLGTKIVQHESSIIRTMVLNNNTSFRSAITYASESYSKFKMQFMNIVKNMVINNELTDDDKLNTHTLDLKIKEVLNKINVGKEGLMPFYNNGVTYILENAYVPSTPAYLGIANCYQPKIAEYTDFPRNEKIFVIIGHDGSYTKCSEIPTVENMMLLRMEELIYDSIQTSFKDKINGIGFSKFVPGKFRKSVYSKQEYMNTYSQFVEEWLIKNRIDVSTHTNFDYSDDNEKAWKTWNYTGTISTDGEELYGSYRAVYRHYYDTHRPDTHPWEMLGFGDKPTWWDSKYGKAPYTSGNIAMWNDIENGIISEGKSKGEYEEYKRPGLFEKYLPVNEVGELKSPLQIGIIKNKPLLQFARAKWCIGDIGDVEFAYMQTSEYRYTMQLVQYLLRPLEWVETNWNTNSNIVLFSDTNEKQLVDIITKKRPSIKNITIHNENIGGSYIRNIGVQQWISDYLISDNLDVSALSAKIRNAEVNLGYRCAGFYKKDSIDITTDSYGEIPSENIHVNLYKSYNKGLKTYSGMIVERTKRGYIIDGFDKTHPYFSVRVPEKFGRKSKIEENGKAVFYYNEWKDDVELIPYRKEFYSEQEVYDVIIGYGKYLEENEGWYFTTRMPSGELSTFRISASSFIKWSTVQTGEDTIGNIILLNPGTVGLGIYVDGMVDDLSKKINGQYSVLDIYGNPIEGKDINAFRNSFNTFIEPKNDKNIGLVKIKTYQLENLITLDNKTMFDDVLYDPRYSTAIERFKLTGVKIKNSYGDLYAPGYLILEEGGIPNFDKKANDLQYIFDVDDVHSYGEYATYAKNIVGYKETKAHKSLFVNDKSMFDFYKGAIREKGTKSFLKKMNRSKYISSAGTDISLYENWAFKVGEFGHISDNSIIELLLDTNKMNQNPQVITFENSTKYYYDYNKQYKQGDVVIYGNTEYVCQFETSGPFNYDNWKVLRYVGDYIIFNGDDNWLKNKKIETTNTFKYIDNAVTNPIGGFPMETDCEHIVFDEKEFEKIKDTVEIGETVWIAKLNNDDWDVKKKTGENRFISMRYPTLRDLYEQQDFDNVYHFTDNNTDYYTYANSKDINLSSEVYSDKDCSVPVLKWGDIHSPIYSGNTGEYVSGKNYKVKLYNTVFYTMVDEERINNESTLQECKNEMQSLTYSNLLLTMSQYGKKTYAYKYKFTLTVDTRAQNVTITINGCKYDRKTVSMVVCGGDVINWKVTADNCVDRTGTENVPTDGSVGYLNIVVPIDYKQGSLIKEITSPTTSAIKLPLVYEGDYEIRLVGGGSGGSGGSYKRHHKYEGNGGASGAYLHGTLHVTSEDIGKNYYIAVGKGGAPGKAQKAAGQTSEHGGDSILFVNSIDNIIAKAQGGAGTWGARSDQRYDNNDPKTGRQLGLGGKYSYITDGTIFTPDGDCINGKDGSRNRHGGKPGESVYKLNGNPYGQGGEREYKRDGKSGYGGYAQIIYKSSLVVREIQKTSVEPFTKEIASSDSYEYSAYNNEYVIPTDEDGKTVYFYSYDVLYKDDNRPSANIVHDLTDFYLNRSKSITAYHKDTVSINEWVNTGGIKYNIDDCVTNEGKYYKCVTEHLSTTTFEISNGDIIYWEEYAPTYYYKITSNIHADGETDASENPSYALYHDYNCTEAVQKNNIDNQFMTCADLDFTRGYTIGNRYYLVDKFATYQQLTPTFLLEPIWGEINQNGNYDVISGLTTYYINADKETIEKNDGLVYADADCKTPVKSIKTDENGKSELVELKYSDLTGVVSDNMETSYELKDGDIILYTKKSKDDISESDIVYEDPKLEKEAGEYGDYIPKWETVEYDGDNVYTNVFNMIEYSSNKCKIYSDKNYKTEVTVYYKDENTNEFYEYIPSICNEEGELEFNTDDNNNLITLYSSKNDESKITSPLYVKLNKNESIYYVNDTKIGDIINVNQRILNGTCLNSVDLYLNEQAIGKYIKSFDVVEDTLSYEKLYIMFDDKEKDVVAKALSTIEINMIQNGISFEEALDKYIEENISSNFYVSKEEITLAFNNKERNEYKHCSQHICKVFGTYRHVENDLSYIKLYMLGNKLYIKTRAFVENMDSHIGICIGDIETISTYTKMNKLETPIIMDKIVNCILYKEHGDYFYVTRDNMVSIKNLKINTCPNILDDMSQVLLKDGTKLNTNEYAWLKLEYLDKEYLYDILATERKMVNSKNIKSCNLVDNDTDGTIVKVQLFDPIQNIIPNNVLNEIDYISSSDPVNNYNDGGKWNDQKVGYLWWDTSKVRYVDYHQGDYEYRRLNWGKQLPGSEIAIMEWTKSVDKPMDDRKYITRTIFNYETDSSETYYYYWVKNPVTVPNVPYRKTSALVISSIINNPTDEGIVWMSPIDGNIYGKNENTFILSNYNNVLAGQNAVLQINFDSNTEVLDHKEWALVREHTTDDIPELLWDKMKVSLLGVKIDANGNELPVPDPTLKGRQRLGLSIRPRQTMFKYIVDARENFIDVVNDIFASRDVDNLSKDINGSLVNVIDEPRVEYVDVASSKLEMMQWRDYGLIGKCVLVKNDETLDNIWTVYRIDSFDKEENGYTLMDYQQFNIEKYLKYIDWYMDENIKYLTPLYVVSSTVDAVDTVKKLPENSIVKYDDKEHGWWELWQNKNKNGILEPTLVARGNQLLQIDSSIYDYVNSNLDDETPYITGETQSGEKFTLTKYEYTYNETQYLLEQLINYFDS